MDFKQFNALNICFNNFSKNSNYIKHQRNFINTEIKELLNGNAKKIQEKFQNIKLQKYQNILKNIVTDSIKLQIEKLLDNFDYSLFNVKKKEFNKHPLFNFSKPKVSKKFGSVGSICITSSPLMAFTGGSCGGYLGVCGIIALAFYFLFKSHPLCSFCFSKTDKDDKIEKTDGCGGKKTYYRKKEGCC